MSIFARLEPGFADIFGDIPKPIDPSRAREATPLSHITPANKPQRETPTDRSDFTRDGDSSGA